MRCPLVQITADLWVDPSEPTVVGVEDGDVVVRNCGESWRVYGEAWEDGDARKCARKIADAVTAARAKGGPA